MNGSSLRVIGALRLHRRLQPLLLAVLLGLLASAAFGLRTKTKTGQSAEALAAHYYGDAARAAVIRAANHLGPDAQPKAGQRLEIPSPVVHTVERGESLGDIAETYLEAEGAEELVAEVNGLKRGKRPKRGSTLTVFAEVEVTTDGRSAEDLAEALLLDRNLGARIRRYNGLQDGAALPKSAYVPLVGLELKTTQKLGDVVAPKPAVQGSVHGGALPAASAPSPETSKVAVAPSEQPATPPAVSSPATLPATSPATSPVARQPPPPEVPGAQATAPPRRTGAMPTTGAMASLKGFSHPMHLKLNFFGTQMKCTGCHSLSSDATAAVRAPTKQQCLICHNDSEEMPPQLRKGKIEKLPLYTDHKSHLDPEGPAAKKQGHAIGCRDCHTPDAEELTGMSWGGHQSCATCHNAGGAKPELVGDVNGLNCTGCHGKVPVLNARNRQTQYLRAHLIRPRGRAGDTFFNHQNHLAMAEGGKEAAGSKRIACIACHADVPQVERGGQVEHVKMEGCVECHRKANRTGLPAPASCAGCHLNMRRGLPPDGQLVQRKPIDHTSFFRRHHAGAAEESPALCASCHAGVDANDGTRCDTCHRVMRPRDHTAGFRDRVHGRLAQMNSQRCVQCHRVERCEACHRVTPKSHFPIARFVDQGTHGSRARLDLGACLTCHRFENSCSRCHTGVQ